MKPRIGGRVLTLSERQRVLFGRYSYASHVGPPAGCDCRACARQGEFRRWLEKHRDVLDEVAAGSTTWPPDVAPPPWVERRASA